MSKFTEFDPEKDILHDPAFSDAEGREHWTLTKPLIFDYNHEGKRIRVIVPMGYRFCCRTVASEHWDLVSPVGPYPQLAAIHEYLVTHKEILVDSQIFQASPVLTSRIIAAVAQVLRMGKGRHAVLSAMNGYVERMAERSNQFSVKINTELKSYGNESLSNIRAALARA